MADQPVADPYDEIAYPSVPFPQTHPDRLSVLATLYGLEPAPVERCRILELGGGDGANLIPMALGLPGATLVGVDLAPGPIARGQQTIQALGLTNITLSCADLRELAEQRPAPADQFDYIIAHGVYSWVPAEVREALLALMDRQLAPHGVAHLSFNAYPGGYMRQMTSEILRYHTAGSDDPQATIQRAKGLARLLVDGMPPFEEATSARVSLKAAADRHPGALFHDELSPVSQPFYFHEVMERAAAHGLQFLAEADFFEMQEYRFSPEVREMLATVEQERGRIGREQYLDFLKMRQFRQPVLCRADVSLTRTPTADDTRRYLAASPMQPSTATPNLRPGAVEEFHGPRQATVRLDLPLAKAVYLALGDAWPDRLSFMELADRAEARLARASLPTGAEDDRRLLTDVLFDGYRAGLIQLYTRKPALAARPGVRPKLSPLARLQVEQEGTPAIATLVHEFVLVESPVIRQLLRLLDGTRDRAALLTSLNTWSRRQRGSPSATPRAAAEEITIEGVEEKLRELARAGLLVS
jgi:methyltransferase-like protein/predicted O-methyltransferase YrrM